MPLPLKFELHAYGEIYDVSGSLLDWQEIEVILSRKDTSGVYMEVTLPFKFVLESYKIIESIFEEYAFKAKADLYIYLRNNDWTYNEPAVFNLDFSTYQQSDTVIEINSRRSDLYEHLKEKESVDFDIPVSDVKENAQWNNARIKTNNEVNFLVSDDYGVVASGRTEYLSITELNSEIFVKGLLEYKTVTKLKEDSFLTSKKNMGLKMRLQIEGMITYTESDYEIPRGFKIYLKRTSSREYLDFNVFYMRDGKYLHFNIGISSLDIDAVKDEEFRLCMDFKTSEETGAPGGSQAVTHIQYNGTLNVSYIERHDPLNISAINPARLLQKLADKITGTEGYAGNPPYPAIIEDFNTDDQDLTMLVAAESIRGFDRAKVHTSYKDFKEWMATQGYEPFINRNQLIFRKREKSFNKNLTAIELTEEDCADLKISIDKDYLFSGLKIGYSKKEYENTNGRLEFNGQHDYTTDYTGNAKELELISPYRADCYGIEFLAQERGKDTTDNKSDNDLFIVNVKKNGGIYNTAYQTITDPRTIDENRKIPQDILDTLFNAKYNPFELLKLNAGLPGASVNHLKFTASDANKDIVIDGERLDSDYTIPEETKLFDAINYDFASRNIRDLPSGDSINGLVKINYKEKTYEGFIKEISRDPAREKETQWILIKKHTV
jgi:hypothetical protein